MSEHLKTVFMTSRPALVRFMRARGAAADEAEDLIQEMFLKLDVQKIGIVDEPRAYLYRMADNLLLDRRRSMTRRLRRENAWSGADDVSSLDGGVDPTRSAEDVLIGRQQLRIVTDALDALPERTREIFRRFRIDGERQKTIALDVGISVSAVEKHLQRAYEVVLAVRSSLDEDIEPPRRLLAASETNDS